MLALINGKLIHSNGKNKTEINTDLNKILYPYWGGVLIQEQNYLTDLDGKQISPTTDEPILHVLISNTFKYYAVTSNAVYSGTEKILDHTLPEYAKIFDLNIFAYYDGQVYYSDGHNYKLDEPLMDLISHDNDERIHIYTYDMNTGLYEYHINGKNITKTHIGFTNSYGEEGITYKNQFNPDEIMDYIFIHDTFYSGIRTGMYVYNKTTNMLHEVYKDSEIISENSYQIVARSEGSWHIYSKVNGSMWCDFSGTELEILDEIKYDVQLKSARNV